MSGVDAAARAVSFDCFGTLVVVPRPENPARAVGEALAARGVDLPADWADAYVESHVEVPDGGELSLAAHTHAALDSRGVDAAPGVVAEAVLAAFERDVEPLPGAAEALAAVDAPLGVLSNCSVPELVPRTLARVGLLESFDAVVTSVDCGWRKPDRRAFTAVADELGVSVPELVHVGDKDGPDGGVRDHGGTYLRVEGDLTDLPERLAAAGVSVR